MGDRVWVIIGDGQVIKAEESTVVLVDSKFVEAYNNSELYAEEVEEHATKQFSALEMIENMELIN